LKFLLDTHLLLWATAWSTSDGAADPMPTEAAQLVDDLDNQLLFSPASIWEVAIKYALGRRDFAVEPRLLRRGLLDNGYQELAINSDHAIAVAGLPAIHKDPFDRLLVAQANAEGILLLTSDQTVARYPGPIRKV
jgi:PIN domain nuclease of toxin-antitoxin system